jgi:ubiquinone biosynthesis protein
MHLMRPEWVPTPLFDRGARAPIDVAPTIPPGRFAGTRVMFRLIWFVLGVVIRGGDAAERGREFRRLLEDLGGLWVKLGQLLSLRVDLFPLEFCRELSQLQVKAVGFAPKEAMKIIEDDLGGPIPRFFDDFQVAPIAAASIGQVHSAVLRGTTTRVAIKIQRPNLPMTFHQQFRVIRAIVWFIRVTGYRAHMRWEELVWELRHIMLEEMDCRFEASSTRRMRNTLRHHGIYVPKVFYATQRVLVAEFVEGVLMTDYIRMLTEDPKQLRGWCNQNGIDAKALGRKLLLSLLRQLMEDNLFHGDLHPGNILLLRDNRVTLIDFGTTSFSDKATHNWFRLSIIALGQRNYSEAADLYLLLSGTLPAGVDAEEIRSEFLQALISWGDRTEVKELPYHDKSIAAIYNVILEILFKHHCTMEWGLLRIRRGLETLDASLIHLYPDCNYSEIAETYGKQATRRAIHQPSGTSTGQTLSSLPAVFEIAERVEEYGIFQAAILRRHLRVFQGASNKATDLLSTAVTQMGVLWLLAAALGLITWLSQRRSSWVGFLGPDLLDRLSRALPVLDWQIWVAALAACLFAGGSLMRLRRRLRRHERRVSEQVATV